MARNELADLWVTGEEFTLTQPGRSPIKLWLQKINDTDHARAVKKAQAAQARVLAVLRDTDSEDYLAHTASAMSMETEEIVERLLQKTRVRVSLAEEAKLAEADEWAEDNYLDGLRTAWRDTLSAQYADALRANEDVDPEVQRVLDELTRFNKAVAAEVEKGLVLQRTRMMERPLPELQDEVTVLLVKDAGTGAWLEEYRRCEVWLGVRRCTHAEHKHSMNHPELYFESRADVDVLQQATRLSLMLAYQSITVDVIEGKDLEETPDSSSSSELLEEPETGVSSGLVAASA